MSSRKGSGGFFAQERMDEVIQIITDKIILLGHPSRHL
jgi:hypothetical protein